MLDHALDARSTQTLIGRKGERMVWDVSQALCQDDRILHGQRCALSSAGRDRVDRITHQDDPPLLPDIGKPVQLSPSADVIAKEGALAKNEVHRVRGGSKAGVRCEATRTDQARVLWWGSVGIDETAGTRVHPITAH